LRWGPDLHTGSDYTRPGDEWGAGYRFSEPGCWTLRARRGVASANVWLKVEAVTPHLVSYVNDDGVRPSNATDPADSSGVSGGWSTYPNAGC
jgi:hypothetical protein